MIIRKYDHLFFDLDNTLWDFDVNARLAIHEAADKLGLLRQIDDFNIFYSFFEKTNTGLWDSYRKQEIRQSELVIKRFEITISRFNLHNVSPENFNKLYLELMPTYNHLVEGAPEVLEYLRGKGYRLHVITNGYSDVQQKKVRNSKLNPYIEKVFASEQVSAPKPDKRIFQYALINCNARKNRSLMIGDTWETDIEGARQFGIDHILFIKNEKNAAIPPKKDSPSFENNIFLQQHPIKNPQSIKKLISLKQIL